MSREPKKNRTDALLSAYWQGADDCRARRPPRPPRGDTRRAYQNGYKNEERFTVAVHNSIAKEARERTRKKAGRR